MTEPNVLRGCECKDCGVHAESNDAPLAYLIERDGKQLKVCTRCRRSGDLVLGLLIDMSAPIDPHFDYDALGTLGVVMYMLEHEEQVPTC